MSKMHRPKWWLRVCTVGAIVLAGCLSFCALDLRSQTQDEIVAVVNGSKITQREVDETVSAQIYPLQQQIYAIRKAALENLIIGRVLQGQANDRGLSIENLKRQLTNVKIEVKPEQVDDLYLEYAANFAAMNPDEAKERLGLDLESQARMRAYKDAIAKFREGAKVEIRLAEPKLDFRANLLSPALGPKEAPVTIIEFSDFQCSYCRDSQIVIRQVLNTYKDKVRWVFVHLPLETHSDAFSAARAAYCAGEQNLFWPYHDQLFASKDLSVKALHKMAAGLGIEASKFDQCLKSPASNLAVRADVRSAKRLAIESTPTFIINGRLFRGVHSFEEFKAAIDNELLPAQRVAPAPQPAHLSP